MAPLPNHAVMVLDARFLDTRFLEQRGIQPAKSQADALVPGLQFCFPHSEKFRSYASVILAEPAGSCTDIAATVLRPLLEDFEHYCVALFTV
jgi:hypothetical protein